MENEINIRERLTAVEESAKQAHHRLNDIGDLTKSVYELATEVKHMREDMNDVAKRVDEIESKPGQRYNLIVTTIITALCSGIVGFIVSSVLNLAR